MVSLLRRLLPVIGGALLVACNPDPGELDEQVGYRDGSDGESQNGERGTVMITEVLWSGSVTNDGEWDPTDVFLELRNESNRPVNVSHWHIVQEGTINETYRLPQVDWQVQVGEHILVVAKTDGCFPEADMVLPDLRLPMDAPFELTVLDIDERLIEPAGNTDMPPFAGGYDLHSSRSMEKIELMFGGRGSEPSAWHYYTDAEVDVPNNDKVAEGCRERTLASPGRPNSPDYSGAYSTGSFE